MGLITRAAEESSEVVLGIMTFLALAFCLESVDYQSRTPDKSKIVKYDHHEHPIFLRLFYSSEVNNRIQLFSFTNRVNCNDYACNKNSMATLFNFGSSEGCKTNQAARNVDFDFVST